MITSTLLNRLAKAEIKMSASRLHGIQTMGQNKMGVEIATFSNLHAFSTQHIPGPSHDVVKGCWDKSAATLRAKTSLPKK